MFFLSGFVCGKLHYGAQTTTQSVFAVPN